MVVHKSFHLIVFVTKAPFSTKNKGFGVPSALGRWPGRPEPQAPHGGVFCVIAVESV